MYHSDSELVNYCIKGDKKALRHLYTKYASKMFGLCLRFAKNKMEAEDILQDGFIKIYSNLESYRHEGSLEGWIRRTFVNTAINSYKRKAKSRDELDIDELEVNDSANNSAIEQMSANEILDYIQEMPDGYRMVFNLNVIEGYTHKKIAEILDISENTSKSQLSRAKALLRKKIIEQRNSK